jgi:hypothetical protein
MTVTELGLSRQSVVIRTDDAARRLLRLEVLVFGTAAEPAPGVDAGER